MDLREKKTKRSIKNAFLQLRRKKELERITVKELAALAEISKATFYLHYRDIYDLSEKLQNEVIQNILSNIGHPEYALGNGCAFATELYHAFYDEQELIEILFSGAQGNVLPMRIETELREFIKKQYPQMSKKEEMLLTYSIYGGYSVYVRYGKQYELEEIIRIVGEASTFAYEPKSE